jgi:hypothetical protein
MVERRTPYFTAVSQHARHSAETASGYYGTPREDKLGPAETLRQRVAHHGTEHLLREAVAGRALGVREAIDYMLTVDFAILDFAAHRPEYFLLKAHALARESMRRDGKANHSPTSFRRASGTASALRRCCGACWRRESRSGGRNRIQRQRKYLCGGVLRTAGGQPFRPTSST